MVILEWTPQVPNQTKQFNLNYFKCLDLKKISLLQNFETVVFRWNMSYLQGSENSENK